MNRNVSRRPMPSEISSAYQQELIDRVLGECVIEQMESQLFTICEMASSICAEQVDKIHSPYTWTIRQVFEHCANAERVFGYRIMRFAAGDATELVGWDENAYAESRFGLGPFGHLVGELGALRQANVYLLRRLVPRAWDRLGVADGKRLSVRAIAWLATGHLDHHLSIVAKRCGLELAVRA